METSLSHAGTARPGRGRVPGQHQHICGRPLEQRVSRSSIRRQGGQVGAHRERPYQRAFFGVSRGSYSKEVNLPQM